MTKKNYPLFAALLCLLLCTSVTQAQEKLWGVTRSGGRYTGGTVFSINKDGTGLTTHHEFQESGNESLTALLYDSGRFTGILERYAGTPEGAGHFLVQVNGDGTGFRELFKFPIAPIRNFQLLSDGFIHGVSSDDKFFRIRPDGSAYAELHQATIQGGVVSLLQDNNTLVGATGKSDSGNGFIFRFDPQTHTYQEVFHFPDYEVLSDLVKGPDGFLYGIGRRGNYQNREFVIFRIRADGSGYSVLHTKTSNYFITFAKLAVTSSGTVVGLAMRASYDDVLFQLDSATHAYQELAVFDTYLLPGGLFAETEEFECYFEGAYEYETQAFYIREKANSRTHGLGARIIPIGNDEFAIADNRYQNIGSSSWVIRYMSDDYLDPLYDSYERFFGSSPLGGLVRTSSNKLFGSTPYNGVMGGFLYQVKEPLLKRFYEFGFGETPLGNGLYAHDGWIYATVTWGGSESTGENGPGQIIRFREEGYEQDLIHQFGYTQGRFPYGRVNYISNGYLYGMTRNGGVNGHGIIYRMRPDGTEFLKVYDFNKPTGKNPYGHVIELSDGYLYGLTSSGGNGNYGAVFRVKPDGTGYQKLHDFNITNGRYPYGSLIYSHDGFLYGTTSGGGQYKNGTLFRIRPDGTGFQNIYHFNSDGTEGAGKGDLTEDAAGVLYLFNGVTLFSVSNDRSTVTRLHTFGPQDETSTLGQYPSLVLFDASPAPASTMKIVGVSSDDKIYSLNTDGSDYEERKFVEHGSHPVTLMAASDGKLYGNTGENYGLHTIFRIDPDGTNHETIFNLDDPASHGSVIRGELVEVGDFLYGVAERGGAYEGGILFRVNKSGDLFEKLFDFQGELGLGPNAGLRDGGDGYLYGTTQWGGLNNYGVVFRVAIATHEYTVIRHFDLANGRYPIGGVLHEGGRLFGVTYSGGNGRRGALYRMETDGSGSTILHHFSEAPIAGLVAGNNGKLYGAFNYSLYTIDQDGAGFQAFGALDVSSLAGALDGSIIGTSHEGVGCGTSFFEVDEASLTVNELYCINYNEYPGVGTSTGKLIDRGDGNYYGLLHDPYAETNGHLFALKQDGSGFSIKFDFGQFDAGSSPVDFIIGSDDNLYMVNHSGGRESTGTITKFTTDGFEKLHDFGYAESDAKLAEDLVDGNLIGVSWGGCSLFAPMTFSLDVDTEVFSYTCHSIYAFFPRSSLIIHGGHLFGISESGGANNGNGFIYRTDGDGSNLEIIYNFDKPTGKRPFGRLLDGEDGYLYGLTNSGGLYNYGVVYRIKPDGSDYQKLFDFNNTNGRYPQGGVTLSQDGSLYGMTREGGVHKRGVVFRINKDGSGFQVVFNFSGSDGQYPASDLVEDEVGNLYGTAGGGAFNRGVLFKLTTGNRAYSKLRDFEVYTISKIVLHDGDIIQPPAEQTTIANLLQVVDREPAMEATPSPGGVVFYPNPFESSFVTEVRNAQPHDFSITITDLNGTIVYRQTLDSELSRYGQDMPKGIYILKVQRGDEIRMHRLVKK